MKPHQWRRSSIGKYLRHLPRIKHIKGTWLHRTLGDRLFVPEMWQPDRQRFAAGFAVGAFFGMIPIPFQMLSAALIAFFTRVNIPAAIAATWLSNPFTAAFFFYIQYKLGSFIIGRGLPTEPREDFWDVIKHAPLPLLTGCFAVGIILSIVVYPLALLGWDWMTPRLLLRKQQAVRKKKPKQKSSPSAPRV